MEISYLLIDLGLTFTLDRLIPEEEQAESPFVTQVTNVSPSDNNSS